MSRLLGVALTTRLVASCEAAGSTPIFPDTPNPIQAGVARTQKGDSWSIGVEGAICLDKPGAVEVTGVRLVRPHGVSVTGFGLRPNQNWKQTAPPGNSEFLGEVRTPLRPLSLRPQRGDAPDRPGHPQFGTTALSLSAASLRQTR